MKFTFQHTKTLWWRITLFNALFIFSTNEYLQGQTTKETQNWHNNAYYKVYLKSGNHFMGRLINETNDKLAFMIGDSSLVTVHESDIKKIIKRKTDQIKNWKYLPDNQFAHKYFLSPSAFNLAKEDIVINSSLLFYKSLEYGISNHLSAGTGISLYPYIIDDNEGPYVNMFKIKVGGWKLLENIHVGMNGYYSLVKDNYFFFYSQYLNKNHDQHLSLSGLITFGNRNNNATFGLGGYQFKGIHYAYVNSIYLEEFKTSSFTTININGMVRLSRSLYLITENWLINSDYFGNKYSLGARYAFNKLLIEAAIIRQDYKDYYNFGSYYDILPLLTVSYKF